MDECKAETTQQLSLIGFANFCNFTLIFENTSQQLDNTLSHLLLTAAERSLTILEKYS